MAPCVPYTPAWRDISPSASCQPALYKAKHRERPSGEPTKGKADTGISQRLRKWPVTSLTQLQASRYLSCYCHALADAAANKTQWNPTATMIKWWRLIDARWQHSGTEAATWRLMKTEDKGLLMSSSARHLTSLAYLKHTKYMVTSSFRHHIYIHLYSLYSISHPIKNWTLFS